MTLEERFAEAQERVKKLAKTPDNEALLSLYALYKQATGGDVTGKRPGMLDFKGQAKFDAWSKKKGTNKADAMEAYVALVDRLAAG